MTHFAKRCLGLQCHHLPPYCSLRWVYPSQRTSLVVAVETGCHGYGGLLYLQKMNLDIITLKASCVVSHCETRGVYERWPRTVHKVVSGLVVVEGLGSTPLFA